MKIAVASGKGGTGKTTVSVNLAWALARSGRRVTLLDCDVEEPNCHIFLRAEIDRRERCTVPVPVVNEDLCTGCGTCQEVCEYNAIIALKSSVMLFPELCHSCGGCVLFCPEHALTERGKVIGDIEQGRAHDVEFIQGKLEIGEVLAPALIRRVKKAAPSQSAAGITIIDAPPGTSCPVIETVKDVDYIVLVTEPTPFGLNDLRLAVDMAKALCIPFGVMVNRDGIGNEDVHGFCRVEDIPVLARIPDDRNIAQVYSNGLLIGNELPQYRQMFADIYAAIVDHMKIKTQI